MSESCYRSVGKLFHFTNLVRVGSLSSLVLISPVRPARELLTRQEIWYPRNSPLIVSTSGGFQETLIELELKRDIQSDNRFSLSFRKCEICCFRKIIPKPAISLLEGKLEGISVMHPRSQFSVLPSSKTFYSVQVCPLGLYQSKS